MILGVDAIIISVDDAEKLVEALELGQRRNRELYDRLRSEGLFVVYDGLRSCIKEWESRLFPEDCD